MRYLKELGETAIVMAGVCLFMIPIVFFVHIANRWECEAVADKMDVDHSYTVFEGCMIIPKGLDKWVPLENYRALD